VTTTNYQPSKEALLAQLDRIQKDSSIKRSKNYRKLLEYLVNREISAIEEGAPHSKNPKETEIAIDVFGKDTDFNPADDSTVRVHISNLRKKLETYFEQVGDNESFYISIPSGEYRLLFFKNSHAQAQLDSDTGNSKVLVKQDTNIKLVLSQNIIVWALVITVMLHGGFLLLNQDDGIAENSLYDQVTHNVWSELQDDKKPVMVVFGETPSQPNRITKGIADAYKNVLGLFEKPRRIKVRLIENLTVDDIQKNHIIYIGDFKSLGVLANYFKGSEFALNEELGSLIGQKTDQHYTMPTDLTQPYEGYGLFAKYNGPRRSKIVLIAGYTDAALNVASGYFTLPWGLVSSNFTQEMHNLEIDDYNNFEFLFKVYGLDGASLSHEVYATSKVDSQAIWK
jgi:hypothetical protein